MTRVADAAWLRYYELRMEQTVWTDAVDAEKPFIYALPSTLDHLLEQAATTETVLEAVAAAERLRADMGYWDTVSANYPWLLLLLVGGRRAFANRGMANDTRLTASVGRFLTDPRMVLSKETVTRTAMRMALMEMMVYHETKRRFEDQMLTVGNLFVADPLAVVWASGQMIKLLS